MKAKEAPEKIYINPNIENRTWLIGKGDTTFTEYTRTDAFIEKTCEWLKEQDEMVGVSFEEDFIERFKNYIKRE